MVIMRERGSTCGDHESGSTNGDGTCVQYMYSYTYTGVRVCTYTHIPAF